jgi:hypothetical protein
MKIILDINCDIEESLNPEVTLFVGTVIETEIHPNGYFIGSITNIEIIEEDE